MSKRFNPILVLFNKKQKTRTEELDSIEQSQDRVQQRQIEIEPLEIGPDICDNPPTAQASGSNTKKFTYQKNWERLYDWLYFDRERGGAFCRVCEQFLSNDQGALQKSQGVFINKPFTNYRNATGNTGKLSKHASSGKHREAVGLNAMYSQAKDKPIHAVLVQQSDSARIQNRKSLSILVHSVYFLAKEEIPHTTKYEPLLRNAVLKNNQSIHEWFEKQSERSSYMSKTTAMELLHCIGNVLDNRDSKLLRNKYFSLMADESTNIKNICEMTIVVRFVSDCGEIIELFLCIVELPGTDAETITETIDKELKKRELDYSKLISLAFDGAANFSGNLTGVRKRISEKAGREIPYKHCRAHLLSLALTSARNKYPKIKRTLQVIKDIYKLFHKSAKREKVFHDIQVALEEKIVKIPETVDTRWLSNHRSIHAVKECYRAIVMACEHIHKDGADLASLAGGILLDITQSSFLVTLVVLDEALGAVNNLSKVLQKENLQLSSVPTLIASTVSHLKDVAAQCISQDENNLLNQGIIVLEERVSGVRAIMGNEPKSASLKEAKKFVDTMIEKMDLRFNQKAVEIIKLTALFESFESIITVTEEDVRKVCSYFPHLNSTDVWLDISSFKYVAKNIPEEESSKNPMSYIYKANIGYANMKKLSEALMCIPVSTAGAERLFSTMNRLMNKVRNRMGQETLQSCMKISTEVDLGEEEVNQVIDLYARQKQRRIRLL